MRSVELRAALPLLAAALACGSSSPHKTFQVTAGDNVMEVSVNGAHCAPDSTTNGYLNKACVSVKICSPGTSASPGPNDCQVIDDVLLDTGSYGLRVFSSVLTVPLTQVQVGGHDLATCVTYLDGSSEWGPVQLADVVLANEPGVTIPIELIDSTYATAPSACGRPETGPSGLFNGVLGLGVFKEDCGDTCVRGIPATPIYFSCAGSCTPTQVPLASQLQNPAASLPQDNNGVIVVLPSGPTTGTTSLEGHLVLGIGTRSNNAPGSATVIPLDTAGNFLTKISSTSMPDSFVDTGSNAYYLSPPGGVSLPECQKSTGWYCPASTLSLTASNEPSAQAVRGVATPFQIANFEQLVGGAPQSYGVFSNVAGTSPAGSGFDWGLPFFMGRTVYLGTDGTTSPLGTGPYLAY